MVKSRLFKVDDYIDATGEFTDNLVWDRMREVLEEVADHMPPLKKQRQDFLVKQLKREGKLK